jgi:uncharacterized protein DUF4326
VSRCLPGTPGNGVQSVPMDADEALVAWAKQHGRFFYIGRQVGGHWKESEWRNPFREGKHGDRAAIIAAYREHLDHSPALKARLDELRGKVLGCWCHPLPCHGDVLCELVNQWTG